MSDEAALDAALRALLTVRGVVHAAVAAADGELVGEASLEGGPASELRELIPTALASSRALGGLLGEGEVRQTLIEYREEPVLLAPIAGAAADGEAHVAVIGLAGVEDLGRVRFQLGRHLAALEQALQAGEGS